MMQPALADRKILREYLDHLAQFDPILLAKLAKSMQQFNAEPLLKKIRVPMLIFAGDNDKFTPLWLSKKMHRLIPKSELCVVKGGTHVALIEQPDLVSLRMEKFLGEKIRKKK
jgi:pimeloyl-ACP methyl ester carboxylesterase